MNFIVHDFGNNDKVNTEYLCVNHYGLNHSPKISWNRIKNAKSYALIMLDPKANNNTFIHWYIPYISPFTNTIDKNLEKLNPIFYNNINLLINQNKLKIVQGQNSLNDFNYFGPCAPNNTGFHPYIFTLYALNSIININQNTIKISSISDFESKIGKLNIIMKESIIFNYNYLNQ